jgi:hypothetical protein
LRSIRAAAHNRPVRSLSRGPITTYLATSVASSTFPGYVAS